MGLYLIGTTVAGVIKFYPVAFEAAWMPFAFDSLRRRDAPALFARMATYAFAVLAVSTVALAGLAPPAVELALPAAYRAAVPLVPLLAVGLAVQSLTWFPMTSVNVAKQTRIFPDRHRDRRRGQRRREPAADSLALACAEPPWRCSSARSLTTAVTAYFAQRAYRIPYEVDAPVESAGHQRSSPMAR